MADQYDLYGAYTDYAVGYTVGLFDAPYYSFQLSVGSQTYRSGITAERGCLFLLDSAITSSTVTSVVVTRYNADQEAIGSDTIPFLGTSTSRGWDWAIQTAIIGTPDQFSAARSALQNKASVEDFHHFIWNNLVAKIYNLLKLRGGNWDGTIATAADTLMTNDSRILTAQRFNAARANLDRVASTGIAAVSRGMPVLAEYFLGLIEAINRAA